MTLLRWELKKIWRPGLLLAIALIGLVFYDVRPGFYIEHFRGNGSDSAFWLASDWLERYGTTIEPEERLELDGQKAAMVAEFDRQIKEGPGAAEAGITDYERFLDWEENDRRSMPTEENSKLFWAIYDHTNQDSLDELTEFMENYDTLAAGGTPGVWGTEVGPYSPAHGPSIRRLDGIERTEVRGILPRALVVSADDFFHYFAIWCVFSAVLLLSPTLVRDRLRRTRPMQWTSRRGRGVLRAQMGAALLSGLLLALLNCAIYLGPILATGALRFWNCTLVSVWDGFSFPWFDWTYGQYLLILLGMTFLLTLAASGFTVVLSWFSGSYVAMLLKAIPLIFVLCWGGVPWIMAGAGLFSGGPVRLTGLPGTETACALLAALVALLLCGLTLRRLRRSEM